MQSPQSPIKKSRRDTKLFALGLLLAALVPTPAEAKPAPKRILFFTRSQVFEHSTIKVGKDEQPFALGVLSALATVNGWDVVHTKDGGLITKEYLDGFSAFFFMTTGDLTLPRMDKQGKPMVDDFNQQPMSADGKAALLAAVAAGKGMVSLHNGTDTFHSPGSRWEENTADMDPYVAMLGGEFIAHGEQQKGRVRVVDKRFPGFGAIGDALELHEEWYSFKNQSPDNHVLLVLESEAMRNPHYARPAFPVAWARKHGKGKVFYSALGHREDIWTLPAFQKMLVGGLKFALGEASANLAPNVLKVAPGYKTLPKQPEAPVKPAEAPVKKADAPAK